MKAMHNCLVSDGMLCLQHTTSIVKVLMLMILISFELAKVTCHTGQSSVFADLDQQPAMLRR